MREDDGAGILLPLGNARTTRTLIMQLVTHPAFLPHHAPSSCEFATLHTNSLTPLLTGMVKQIGP